MQANPRFQNLDKKFWANVRTISESLGYTDKKSRQIKVYLLDEIIRVMSSQGFSTTHLVSPDGTPTQTAHMLHSYVQYRAEALNTFVQPRLMDAERAAQTFDELRQKLNSTLPVPMNKQSGDKKRPAYLTGIVNLLIEAHAEGLPCDYDPRRLTSFTQAGELSRTLARRVDGCFPGCVNPIAIWEIKEYYHTTTFGSRVADGVYESLLDGLELEELRLNTGIGVHHLLIVDAYYTWWELGRSYLCRMMDMLHMGYVDEVLFGFEVVERLPIIVSGWVKTIKERE